MLNITSIKQIINASRYPATLEVVDDRFTNYTLSFAPLEVRNGLDIWIPWAQQSADYAGHHIVLTVGGRKFAIWQTNDNKRVRLAGPPWVNPNLPWSSAAGNIFGVSVAEGDRAMVINSWGPMLETRTSIWDLLPQMVSEQLRNFGKSLLPPVYHLSWTGSSHANRVGSSTPKWSATAFSMAGIPSDALDQRSGASRFLYRDSGKRYEFSIRSGVVYARDPDGSELALNRVVSYDAKRLGEYSIAPPFDMVAASGGRVLAKAQNSDRFYFASMDEMFINSGNAGEFGIPSTYFKLDPEWNLDTANTADLTMHLTGEFGSHPGSERFFLFRLAEELGVMQFLIPRMRRYIWHLIDTRPPVNVNPIAALESGAVSNGDFSALFKPLDMPPPANAPGYKHVEYTPAPATPPAPTLQRYSVDFDLVQDIGVGAVHFHEQYECVTGGELQPLRSRPLAPFPGADYAMTYRLFNGPMRDGDGYCDGTVNYYILVRLYGGSYRILFIDEQMFFTQRWRVVGPDDHAGMAFELGLDLEADQQRPSFLQRYGWVRANYWDPFVDLPGAITARSRMAVATMVILVTGEDPVQGPVIYSINASYNTLDRSWRWRKLPPSTTARYFTQADIDAGNEPISTTEADLVYPQTIRLREDMTLHMKGTRRRGDGIIEVGRWYQRYLPANNKPTPEDKITPGQPTTGYTHAWKFLPEAVFALADKFSHFGVYDIVNSRTQYYIVTPKTAADAPSLQGGVADRWIDENRRLFIVAWKFPWDGRLHSREALRPPSKYNSETGLTVVSRGSLGWIAMHWDKRDDDMMPFDGLPADVLLSRAGIIGILTANVTVLSNILVEEPPVVSLVQLSANPAGDITEIRFLTPQTTRKLTDVQKARLTANPRAFVLENVWRMRMAAFSGTTPVVLLEVTTESFTAVTDFEYRLTLTAAQQATLRPYCPGSAVSQKGTTIWFEDIVGHVAPPQEIHWPTMYVSVQPSPITATGAVQVTVFAKDDTGQAITGTVSIAGYAPQPTNAPFTINLTSTTPPAGTVSANGYPNVSIVWPQVILPSLNIKVQPAPIIASGMVQITVNATNQAGVPVAGTVTIAGNPSHPTNTLFSIYLTDTTPPLGTVSAPGYATVPLPWPTLIKSTYSAGFADMGRGIGGSLL